MRRGPYKGRSEKYEEARSLRASGMSYAMIARRVGAPAFTVRGWTSDIPIDMSVVMRAGRLDAGRAATASTELRGNKAIRSFLSRIRGYRCEHCGISEWQGKPIILEVDHINGDNSDNRECNLRLLCPNCHSQTPTWKRRKPCPTTPILAEGAASEAA